MLIASQRELSNVSWVESQALVSWLLAPLLMGSSSNFRSLALKDLTWGSVSTDPNLTPHADPILTPYMN
jgi:hypothetical protein